TLGGVVRDEEGSPIAGAAIGLVLSAPMGCSWPYAFRFSDTDDWPPPCTTDEAGRYEWLSFPEERAGVGRWVLTAEHQDFVPGMVQAVESLPPDPHGVIHADFTLGKATPLRGRTLGPGGRPLPAATVTLRGEPTPDQPICVRLE